MTSEWIRFIICAVFVVAGLMLFGASALGVNRFDFVLNRMHAAGIGDTMGLFCVIIGLIVASGVNAVSLKLASAWILMWLSSPVSTHLLALVEYRSNKRLGEHCKLPEEDNGSI